MRIIKQIKLKNNKSPKNQPAQPNKKKVLRKKQDEANQKEVTPRPNTKPPLQFKYKMLMTQELMTKCLI